MAQPESKLSRDIMAELRARGIWCFKVHGGPTMMAGVPDIIACVPMFIEEAPDVMDPDRPIGLFVGFETKMPGGEVSAIQARRHDDIRTAGGLVCVPHSVEEALTFIAGITTGTTDDD